MMKLRNFMAVACMASAVWSMSACSEEEMQGQKAQGVQTIVASVGGSETRTWVGNDEKEVLWSENDAFGVLYTKGESLPAESKFFEYKIKADDADKASATFELKGNASGYTMGTYAVYPYQDLMTISEDELAVTMTMNETSPVAHTKNSNGPMYAVISGGKPNNVRFHHLAALLKVTLNNMPEKATQLKVTASNIIAGKFTAILSGPEPELVAAQGNADPANKSVTVTLPVYSPGESVTFYVPLPAGMYANLNVSLLGEASNIIYTKSWSDIDVKKADLLTAALDVVTIDATASTDINTALANAIKTPETTTNIALTGEIDTQNTTTDAIEIPVIERSNASLAFTNLTSTVEEPLVLKAADGGGEASTEAVNKVSIAVPEVEANAAPSLTITLPKTTVTLGSINEKAVYNKVIAKTATNTIIVAAGVTVKELEIAGGNVEIYGIVEKLTISADNMADEITVASGGAADIQTVEDDGGKFKFTSTWDGTSAVKPTIVSGAEESYNIYTAAQLASFQLKVVPTEATAAELPATIDKSINLYADIDLTNKPWVGMVLGESCHFEGVKRGAAAPVISNVLVTEHALTETSIYTPEACVGLFAATKRNSQIKYITVDGFKSQDKGADAKWSGALVGCSYGTTLYEGCTAKNVTIQSDALMAYRIGGLIGFILKTSKTDDLAVIVKDCHAENVTIKGGFCLAGLVGSIQGQADRTFIDCTTSGVSLTIPETSPALKGAWSDPTFYAPYFNWAGYMSLFVGEINMGGIVTFTNCEAKDAAFTPEKLTSFGYDDIADYSYGKNATQEAIDAAIANAKHYKLEDSKNKLLPACVDKGTVVVGEKELVSGEDYNLFTKL